MFRPVSCGFSTLSASFTVMDECVMTPVPSPYCSIQGLSTAGGGGGLAWRFQSAGQTDVGRMREENQDAFSLRPDKGLFVVADGMGGHRGGKVASRMAVDGIEDFAQILPSMSSMERLAILQGAFNLCSSQVHAKGNSELEFYGMGTTLVALHVDEVAGRYYVANVGDSRVYRIRERCLKQLTEDHSLYNGWKKMGLAPEKLSSVSRSVITRAIGIEEHVETDVQFSELQADDSFLLCTDGLTEVLFEDEMLQIILAHDDLATACRELIDRANDAGGPDNITAVLVRALRAT
jgi:protein phosphatase